MAALERLLAGPALRQLDSPGPDGCTPLHVAARLGHLATAEALLQAGADASARDAAGGATPLHCAAAAQDGPMVQLLLNHGAHAAACNRVGHTALHSAAASCLPGEASAALLALARRAPPLLGRAAGAPSGDLPLHLLCRLPQERCLPTLQAIASGGLLAAELLSSANGGGWTPLALAAAAGSAAVVELLLGCGASPLPECCPACSRSGQAAGNGVQCGSGLPCHQGQAAAACTCPLAAAAAAAPDYSCLLALLQAGASAKQLSCAVLEQACRRGRLDVAGALLAAGLRPSGVEAQQLLLVAVEREDGGMLAALLHQGERGVAFLQFGFEVGNQGWC